MDFLWPFQPFPSRPNALSGRPETSPPVRSVNLKPVNPVTDHLDDSICRDIERGTPINGCAGKLESQRRRDTRTVFDDIDPPGDTGLREEDTRRRRPGGDEHVVRII